MKWFARLAVGALAAASLWEAASGKPGEIPVTHDHAETTPEAAVTAKTNQKARPRKSNETAVYVADMHCAGCAKKIAARLYKVKGVAGVRTQLDADLAIVTPGKKGVDPEAIWSAMTLAGYPPTKLVSPLGIFVADGEGGTPRRVAEAPKSSESK